MKKNLVKVLIVLLLSSLTFIDGYGQRRGRGGNSSYTPKSEYESTTSSKSYESEAKTSTEKNFDNVKGEFETKTGNDFEQAYSREDAKVYFSFRDGFLKVISNYKESASSDGYKETSHHSVDFEQTVKDVTGIEGDAIYNIEVVVEQQLFLKNPTVYNFEKFHNVSLVTSKGKTYPLEILPFENGDNVIAAQYASNCYVSANIKFDNLLKDLYSKEVQKNELELVSLITNTSTNEKIKNTFPNNHKIVEAKTEAEFINQLKSSKRKTIFLLGHIVNGKYRNYSSSNELLFELDVARLKEISEEVGINIFPVGCNSAEFAGYGMTNPFNSYEAAEILGRALNKSTLGEVIEEIARSENMKILIDENMFTDYKYGEKYKVVKIIGKEAGKYTLIGVLLLLDNPEEEEDVDEEKKQGWWSFVKKNSGYIALISFILFLFIPQDTYEDWIDVVSFIVSAIFIISLIIFIASFFW